MRTVGRPKGDGNSARETRRAMFRGFCGGGRRREARSERGQEGEEKLEEKEEEEERNRWKGEKTLRVEESRAGRASRWKQAGWINFGATVPEADA